MRTSRAMNPGSAAGPLRRLLAWTSAVALSSALAACGGGGGGGPTGPTGPVGPVGPPGGGSPSDPMAEYEPLPGVNLVITSVTGGTAPGGQFIAGDLVTVYFTAKDDDGNELDVPSMDSGSIYVSGPSFNYQRVIASQSDLRAASVPVGGGVWAYTFPTPIPAAYLPPLNDTPAFGVADGELQGQALLDGTYTVGMQAYINRLVGVDEFRDAGNAVFDFLYGAATTIETRDVVGMANCNMCHTELAVHGGGRKDVRLCVLCHTAGAEDRNTPSVAGGTPGVSIDFKVMIHKLHSGRHLPSVLGITTNPDGSRNYLATPVPYELIGFNDSLLDFSDVNFPVWPNFNVALPKNLGYSTLSSTDPDGSGPLLSPKSRDDTRRTGVTKCDKCHGDPDGAGPLAAPAHGGLCYTQPTMQSCGSCHDDIDWTKPYTQNGSTMPIQAANGGCLICHSPTGGSLPIKESHVHPLNNPAIDPGVVATMTAVTGGTGAGGNFQAGDAPTITFTLKNEAGADIGVSTMDSAASFFMGSNANRQVIQPPTSPNGVALNPFDFTGRLMTASSTNKGTMSKVFLGTPAVKETLVVEFTSATAFSVTGTTSGPLGVGALPASTSTNPSNGTITNFDLGSSLSSGTATVAFSSATAFTVTVLGIPIGAGTLPAATNASTRFTSPSFSFNIAVGSTAFASGNTFNIAIFKGTALNPVTFAVVAGKTAFAFAAPAPDRFFYEVVPNAPTYTMKLPMDLMTEFLGDSTGVPGQVLPAPGNLPVYFGRQTLSEATLSTLAPPPAVGTTLALAAVARQARFMDVVATTGFANNDTVVIEPAGGVGVREYVQIQPTKSDSSTAAAGDTTVRLYFRTVLRYPHAAGVTVTKVNLAFKQEGAAGAYTLNPATGVITGGPAFTVGAALVLSYRSDARFGFRRHPGDALQAYYCAPPNESPLVGQEAGDWKGLAYLDGTYIADIYLYKNIDLGLQNELQTYRSTSNSAQLPFLFGSASTIEPRHVIESPATCYACHDDVMFHGGGRRGVDTCLTCHGVGGGVNTMVSATTPVVPIEFRNMLHKIHMGADLTNGATYPFANDGEFPAMPGGVKQCVKCHGNDSWQAPAPRVHPAATVSVRTWGVVCGSCHDSDAVRAHIDVSTPGGVESCDVCHGPFAPQDVVKVHFPR